jgi:hypothetical protein
MVILLGLENSFGTTFAKLDSAYLGSGWFQYRLQVLNDRFFTVGVISSVYLNFTNQIELGTIPTNWSYNFSSQGVSYWSRTNNYWPDRPYEDIFLLHSSETSFRLATNEMHLGTNTVDTGAQVWFSAGVSLANPLGGGPVFSINGFARMPCLVPCGPESANGAPTNYSYSLKLLPDISLELLKQNGEIYGLSFDWDYESTFALEASTNLDTWTTIGNLWSSVPKTTWISDEPLNDFGQYFRLELVANGHQTDPPPLNSNNPYLAAVNQSWMGKMDTVGSQSNALPRVGGGRISEGQITVNIITEPNQTCIINAVDNHKAIRATRQITATNDCATVVFDAANLPSPVFFQVAALSTP